MTAQVHLSEVSGDPERLEALDVLDVLDSPSEQEFDRTSKLIKLIFGVDIGIVSLIDAHRQWYKSVVGMDTSEADLQGSFCRHTLVSGQPVVVPDTTKDARFSSSIHVTSGPRIRFYAGMPLKTRDGHVVGTICAIHSHAREFGERDIAILGHLAESVMNGLELRQMASTDVLTGVMSRRAFKDEGAKHLSLAKRHKTPTSCIVLDLDHFKNINDGYGHAAGDQVLSGVARAAKGLLRNSDLLGRLGGEEFAILLPQTEGPMAVEVAEKLRQYIGALRFPGSLPPIRATASFGVAALEEGDDIEALIHKADGALYQAKRSGRNRTCIASASDSLRQVNRRRVLKAGEIVTSSQSVFNCTVRSMWDGGAELLVSLPTQVPDQFALNIRGGASRQPCKLIHRGHASVEVAFVDQA